MKNLTAKETLELNGVDTDKLSFDAPYSYYNILKAMEQYAKAEVKKENTRLHDRFIEAMPVGYFDNTKEFLKMRDLIFNENYNLR